MEPIRKKPKKSQKLNIMNNEDFRTLSVEKQFSEIRSCLYTLVKRNQGKLTVTYKPNSHIGTESFQANGLLRTVYSTVKLRNFSENLIVCQYK